MTIDHQELLTGYENILKRRNVLSLRLASLLVGILFPLFWILDWVVLPDWVRFTLALRLVGTMYSMGVWIMTYRRGDLVYRHTDPLAISVGVLIAGLISVMTWLDNGYESPYYAGLNLVILGCSFLFAWPLRQSLGFILLIYGFYMTPLLLNTLPVHEPGIALTNQFFILSTMLISVISQRHRLAQERKDYIAIQQHRAQLEQAQILAATDPLTGLYNRREFFSLGAYELEHARRLNKPLSVLAIDVDDFKQINDTYGHPVGDDMLRMAACAFQSSLRQDDILARVGGDEFMALLPATDLREAAAIAERIQHTMPSLSIQSAPRSLQATISVGVAPLTEDIVDLNALLLRTDEALYAAKHAGKARVHIWSLPSV